MRVLVLSPYPPFPPRSGGALRIYHLVRALAAHHTVTLLTFADAAAAAALAPLRESMQLITVPPPPPRSLLRRAVTTLLSPLPDMALRNADAAFARALQQLLSTQPFDAVQAESIEMAGYLAAARRAGLLTVLDEFNAEALLQWRTARQDLSRPLAGCGRALIGGLYSAIQAAKLQRYERRMIAACDHTLVVSHEDEAELRRLVPQARLHVVYNGVDSTRFAARSAVPANHDVVFSATLDYRPNVDALRWFVAEVLPLLLQQLPAARLRIVGRSPTPAVQALHNGRSVIVVGEVEDVRAELTQAALAVIPMRVGGGSRLKLIEALALALPVVSTPLGAMGIPGLQDDVHLRIVAQPAAFADAVAVLLRDPQHAAALGRNGRALVAERYDWQAVAPALLAVYQSP